MAPERFTQESLGSYTFSSLRIDREQHVPDSSNHSLYLRKQFSFSNREGNLAGNQQPDGSISLSPSPLPCLLHHHNHNHDHHNNTQHINRDRDRDRDRDKTQVLRTICTSDTFHDVRFEEAFDLPQWFLFFCYICYIYIYVIVNRQGHHNIQNGIVWVQTGHSTCTCTVSLHVIEL